MSRGRGSDDGVEHGATDHLGGSVDEHPLGGRIGLSDRAAVVHADDGVERGLEDERVTRRRLAQALLLRFQVACRDRAHREVQEGTHGDQRTAQATRVGRVGVDDARHELGGEGADDVVPGGEVEAHLGVDGALLSQILEVGDPVAVHRPLESVARRRLLGGKQLRRHRPEQGAKLQMRLRLLGGGRRDRVEVLFVYRPEIAELRLELWGKLSTRRRVVTGRHHVRFPP